MEQFFRSAVETADIVDFTSGIAKSAVFGRHHRDRRLLQGLRGQRRHRGRRQGDHRDGGHHLGGACCCRTSSSPSCSSPCERTAAAGEALIRWEGLWKAFGPKRIFEGLDLEVRRGETLTIIGGSGTGKSVMLKCLIGLLYPDRGRILFEGGDVTTFGEKEIREVRKRVAMVFQGAALFDSLTVGENIAYPLREHLKELSEDGDRASGWPRTSRW